MPTEAVAKASALAPAAALRGGIVANHIGGEWPVPDSASLGPDIDPAAPDHALATVVRSSVRDVELALECAESALRAWRKTSPLARAAILVRAAQILRARADRIALALTREEGKPLVEAQGEVGRTAEVLEATAALVYRPEGESFASRRREQWLLTRRSPLGVVVIIGPWNFPILIPAWKLAPALLAGNTVVMKPAELTPLSAAHLLDVFVEAGLPPGVFNVIYGSGAELGAALLRAPAAAVSFTGGNAAGGVVAAAAASAHIKAQLELGGNNPVLVVADADLDLATREIVAGAISSTGQKCTATRRVFAEAPIHDELVARVRAALARVRIGPGADTGTTVGPLVSEQARTDFLVALERVEAVAKVQRFGETPDVGYFVAPSLALEGDPRDDAFREEIFGPLISVFRIEDFDQGVELCNDTPYGLSASLFSTSITSALEFSDRIDAGMVHINSQTTGAEPHIPFGGMKRSSSHTRELGSHGLEFFSQVKTIYLEGA